MNWVHGKARFASPQQRASRSKAYELRSTQRGELPSCGFGREAVALPAQWLREDEITQSLLLLSKNRFQNRRPTSVQPLAFRLGTA
jgi:hypothetical protein